MGFRPQAGVVGLVAGVGLVVVFAFGLPWVFTTLGLLMRAPNAVLNAGFMDVFPLTFLSNTFVDPRTLPAWLEAFVGVNPISQLVTASRGLMDRRVRAGHELPVSGAGVEHRASYGPT